MAILGLFILSEYKKKSLSYIGSKATVPPSIKVSEILDIKFVLEWVGIKAKVVLFFIAGIPETSGSWYLPMKMYDLFAWTIPFGLEEFVDPLE